MGIMPVLHVNSTFTALAKCEERNKDKSGVERVGNKAKISRESYAKRERKGTMRMQMDKGMNLKPASQCI